MQSLRSKKIDEDGTKTNFDKSLLEWFMLRSHAADNHVPTEYALCQMQKHI